MFRTTYAPGILSGIDVSDPPHIMMLICNTIYNWDKALSSVFADHWHEVVTFGYNCYVAAGQPYRVVKTAGLNLSPFITCMSALSWIGVMRRLG